MLLGRCYLLRRARYALSEVAAFGQFAEQPSLVADSSGDAKEVSRRAAGGTEKERIEENIDVLL
jgi:hypothetical protein